MALGRGFTIVCAYCILRGVLNILLMIVAAARGGSPRQICQFSDVRCLCEQELLPAGCCPNSAMQQSSSTSSPSCRHGQWIDPTAVRKDMMNEQGCATVGGQFLPLHAGEGDNSGTFMMAHLILNTGGYPPMAYAYPLPEYQSSPGTNHHSCENWAQAVQPMYLDAGHLWYSGRGEAYAIGVPPKR